MKLRSLHLLWALAACSTPEEATLETTVEALTAEQCMFFEECGHVTICHATGNPRRPYREIRVGRRACINAHADHPGDSIAVDGDCGPNACLAEHTPCDATRPCCDELTCTDGVCTAAPLVCVTESFDGLGCNQNLPAGTEILGGAATMTRVIGSAPLAVYQAGTEACEFSFGPCSSFNVDATTPSSLLVASDNQYSIRFDFTGLQESFTASKVYGLMETTVTFYREGVAVLTDVINRDPETNPDVACEVGDTRSWAPAGGFDQIVVSGGIFAIDALETCHR